jgi:geranylgeranyl diphosphate synthase type II
MNRSTVPVRKEKPAHQASSFSYDEAALLAYLKKGRRDVDRVLAQILSEEQTRSCRFYEAVRYSLMAGGKRFRPILSVAAAESVGGIREQALPISAAIELIHTYSLVHDDLPAMDDDALRRGKPTSHVVYGEGTAILVGDALLTEAFVFLTQPDHASGLSAEDRLRIVSELALSAGMNGMVLGQWMDLQSEKESEIGINRLRAIHQNKTGALITASVRIGAILGGATSRQMKQLTEYGKKIGLAFQIMDDLLDVLGEESKLGKSVQQDQAKNKWTYPRQMGIRRSKQEADRLTHLALSALDSFGDEANPLRWIALYSVNRKS